MKTVGARLKYARNQTGMRQGDLATACGFKGGQRRISNYESDDREPSYADLTLMGKVLGVNAAWLAFGGADGEEESLPIAQAATVDSQVVQLRVMTEEELLSTKSNRRPDPARFIRLDTRELARVNVTVNSVFGYRATGNSMAPVITDGAMLGINPIETQVRDGELYLIKQGGLVRARLLYRLPNGYRLKSYNEGEWPIETLESPTKAEFAVIGRIFWISAIR